MEKRPAPRPPPPPPGLPPPIGAHVPEENHPDDDVCRALTRVLWTARALENRTISLYREGVIVGGCYSGMGNEATSVGSAWVLGEGDHLVPTHRCLGAHLVRGHTILDVLRQYMKRATSQTGGKDAGLHLGREGSGIVGMISPLAHMLPVAAGIALAERQRGRQCLVLASVGDGSTSLGDFHEALNFAAVQKLSVLFLIINNQYAYSTPITLQYACRELSLRAAGYGIEGQRVDGTDLVEVLTAAQAARVRALGGEGPTLLECVTMRMRGHSEHDDFRYVPSSLLQAWKNWDPISRWRAYLLDRGVATEAWTDALFSSIEKEIEDAVSVAQNEPLPPPQTSIEGVYRHWDPTWTVPEEGSFDP